jgi:serine/threonine protein kinase/tetratricopeptide (TPR) repeat protein
MSIPQGTRLGRYEIGAPLGAGAMGEVYLANDLSLHRPVAVKFLLPDVTTNEDRLKRFEREAYAASSLNHPNILTIYEIGHEDEYHFIVTEFVDGESLGQRLRREPIPVEDSLELGVQIASALAAAHAAGIIHRDIKPDNIMLRRDRLVKVLDFGLAKLLRDQPTDTGEMTRVMHETMPGVVMGTLRYMSPEQARGLPLDPRTDIWSLGVVLYQMISGNLPFPGRTFSDIVAAVLKTEPPALTTIAPDVPAELERIVTRSLRKEQTERYQSAKDLELDLRNLRQRLAFEAELERSGRASGSGEAKPVTTKLRGKTDEVAPTTVVDDLTHVRAASSAEYLVSSIQQHRRGALAILAAIVVLSMVAAYFVHNRYLVGSSNAITSLAVLPFVNISNDPEKEYLSDGISESLINRLSQLPGVKVIANSSSSKYKGKDAAADEVARALDVAAVLTGRILQRGDNLVISVELVNGRDRTQLWGQQYNRKAEDLLAVQGEISREIADTLRLRLSAGQQQQLARVGMVKPEAYELLLKGRFHSSRGTTEDREKAGEYFKQSIEADPTYALAYADLSDIYRSLVNSGVLDPKEYLPKAEAAAQKSLELDDSLAEGHYSLANLKTYAWQWDDAEREYKRAIELDPNLALAHRWYATYLRLRGQHQQAADEIRRARELDPLSAGVNATVGYLFYGARQYDKAIESLKKTLELDPNYPYAHLFLGFTYAAKGMYPEAIADYQEAIKLGLDTPSTQIRLGAAYAAAGDRQKAQAILKRLQASTEHISGAELASLYAVLGEREQAFASLEKAYETHDLQLQYLGVSPEYDPLRSDPRFQDLLRRVGLANNL